MLRNLKCINIAINNLLMDTQNVFVMKNSHQHQMTQNMTAAISKPLKYLPVIMFLSLEKLQAWNNFTIYTNFALEIPAIEVNWNPDYKIISWTKFSFPNYRNSAYRVWGFILIQPGMFHIRQRRSDTNGCETTSGMYC